MLSLWHCLGKCLECSPSTNDSFAKALCSLSPGVVVKTAQCRAGDFQERHNSLGTVSCMAQKYFLNSSFEIMSTRV